MSALLRFFVRFALFFEFLLLEIIAFVLIFNTNAFQQSVIYNANTAIVASVYQVTSTWSDYFHLGIDNQKLAQENELLANRVAFLETKLASLKDTTMGIAPDYRAISAKVVYSSVNKIQNYILINKGKDYGLAPDMGVLSGESVVGVIESVSEHFSIVLPIVNSKLLVSGKLKASNALGSVNWNGFSPSVAQLREIPNHVEVVTGDSVVTSGYSAIFPEGILIGVIDNVDYHEHKTFCDISLKLATNFNALNYVRVIDFTNRKEQKEIEIPLH
ncbi:MAG TPA: rod shape-determining protein MreC [Paludibacteraceae bacterium]|nr:rod shape-determining protein MreC [Paludibacteraceae bacterium]